MATTNRERIQKGLETLRDTLEPFVERGLRDGMGDNWIAHLLLKERDVQLDNAGKPHWDNQLLLKTMWNHWRDYFEGKFPDARPVRNLVSELLTVRNTWAHEKPFSYDDTYRALDSMVRLARAVKSPEESNLERQRDEVMRVRFAEQARNETRKLQGVEGGAKEGLKPWREVVQPHPDVSAGRYQVAEFAADLSQVYMGRASSEYADPVEFYSRTFLTEGLKDLLSGALQRLHGTGGDPVLELQTNFGGGKTHSMLALYHLFSGTPALELPGAEKLLEQAGVSAAPKANRVVLVGTALSAAQGKIHEDGTQTHTIWGDLAYQLGGAAAYRLLEGSDRAGTNPGSEVLIQLLTQHQPVLILIDEWVAFLRELVGRNPAQHELPAGSFESNLSFAQSLTEAIKAVPRALLVASLPASNVEIGGPAGQVALESLSKTFQRVQSTWRPASPEESFEIVRRRLFQPLSSEGYIARDAVIRECLGMYRSSAADFPTGVSEASYKLKLERAYPIHPSLFEALFEAWGALEKFQRTRGVLRLMAIVVHALWESQDRNLMIYPGTVPLDARAVQDELKKYLPDSWETIIAADIDGDNSIPVRLEREDAKMGKLGAARRVARSLFLATAPLTGAAVKGIDNKQVFLSAIQPGEPFGPFSDAVRRIADQATYLYSEGNRYWYSTQPSLARTALERAQELEEHLVFAELEKRLRNMARERSGSASVFSAVHVCPESGADVSDEFREPNARLVILGPQYPHTARALDSKARVQMQQILEKRGNADRLGRNTLLFIAADISKLDNTLEQTRQFLAWQSILSDEDRLNLTPSDTRQVKAKRDSHNSTVDTLLKDTWLFGFSPHQSTGSTTSLEWDECRLPNGTAEGLVARAGQKFVSEDAVIQNLAGLLLEKEISKWLWGDRPHLSIKTLLEYFAQYPYLYLLRNRDVLFAAIRDGVAAKQPYFGYADAFASGRYRNLCFGETPNVQNHDAAVLVHRDAAQKQIEADQDKRLEGQQTPPGAIASTPKLEGSSVPGQFINPSTTTVLPKVKSLPTRFFAHGELDPLRATKQMHELLEEVISHLSNALGSQVVLRLEIEAKLPEGLDEALQRTVLENSRTLKFKPDVLD